MGQKGAVVVLTIILEATISWLWHCGAKSNFIAFAKDSRLVLPNFDAVYLKKCVKILLKETSS